MWPVRTWWKGFVQFLGYQSLMPVKSRLYQKISHSGDSSPNLLIRLGPGDMRKILEKLPHVKPEIWND